MLGQTIAHYKVTAKLGAGGMGEVYRATDSKLGRDVALKVLPPAFAQDAQRMTRFQREAQLLASLNHPNIATIHGLEESGATRALVMELVEGPTLAERIATGAIPLEEALPIARQIADALEYAHERGIIHRDLKPANIKLTPDGKVKVLDFGLAKALADDATSPDTNASPTLSMAATKAGVILGTAAYMSPEQAKGKTADRRADVWAFGCVLFEMLTGKQAFAGDTATEILAEVLRAEPAWPTLPANTPAPVRRLLRRALQKDPHLRLHSIADARLELDEAPPEEAVVAAPAVGSRAKALVPWVVAALSLAGLAAALLLGGPKPPENQVTRFTFGENLSLFFARSLAISPDGKRLAYIHETGGLAEVYVRGLDEFTAGPLRGATLAREPFFSPDGQALGFVSSDLKIRKYSFTDGTVSLVCDCGANSASWAEGNRIVFSTVRRLAEVSGDGGEPRELAVIDAAKGEAFYSPWVLPGGRTALFTSASRSNSGSTTQSRLVIEAISLGDKQRKTVLENAASAIYSPTGHLLFYRDGAMLAAPFDAARVEVTGPAVRVLESVAAGGGDGSLKAALSRNGVLMYATPEASQLVWVNRSGEVSILRSEPGTYANPRLSQDGSRLVVAESSSVWVLDLNRQTYSILGIDSFDRSFPIWTRDGERIIYSDENILWKRSDGAGPAEYLLTEPEGRKIPTSLSPDGKELVFMLLGGPASGGDIYVAPLEGERKARPFLNTRAYEGGGQLSPSGKVMAYVSDETGRREVYVTPYPGPGRRLQVSTDGGTHPLWNPSGGELFYRLGPRMMAVKISESPQLSASKPQLLFEGPYAYGAGTTIANFTVSRDGQRFAMVRVTPGQHARIHVVVNWFEELRRTMNPGKN